MLRILYDRYRSHLVTGTKTLPLASFPLILLDLDLPFPSYLLAAKAQSSQH